MWGDELIDPVPMDTKTEEVCAGCNLVHNRFLTSCPDCELFGDGARLTSFGVALHRWAREDRAKRTLAGRRAQDAVDRRLVAV